MAHGDKWPLGATHLVAFIAQSHCLFLGSHKLFYRISMTFSRNLLSPKHKTSLCLISTRSLAFTKHRQQIEENDKLYHFEAFVKGRCLHDLHSSTSKIRKIVVRPSNWPPDHSNLYIRWSRIKKWRSFMTLGTKLGEACGVALRNI